MPNVLDEKIKAVVASHGWFKTALSVAFAALSYLKAKNVFSKGSGPKLVLAIAIAATIACGDGLGGKPVSGPSETCVITINGNSNNAACRDANQTIPEPKVSPSPVDAQDCRVDYLSGSGPEFIALGTEVEFDLTPMQTFVDDKGASQVREVSKACNEPKSSSVEWVPGDERKLSVVNLGFKAKAKRIGSGLVTLTVKFDGKAKVFQVN